MTLLAQPARVGARGIDCLTSLTPNSAAALKAAGIDFVVRYLGSINPVELAVIVNAGLAFMPVTFGNSHDGPTAVSQCNALNLPATTTVWIDVEGKTAWDTSPNVLADNINKWCDSVSTAGFMPGMYVGEPQPFTSQQLYSLKTVRYWKGQGRCVDHSGALAEPNCGWCVTQLWPSVTWAGTWVDVNFIGEDYEKRVPNWVARG